MRSVAPAFPAGQALLQALPVWRADQLHSSADAQGVGTGVASAVLPTGHATLDAELPGGGWPAAGLIELLLSESGCGELRLLAPVLASASLLWVAPPLTPYAPALAALGIAAERVAIAMPASAADATWATEQALRSGALGAVLWWQGEARVPALPATLRRLHLAAEQGRTPLFALRPALLRAQSSPAPLRLALEPAGPAQLAVEVFKRRGPPMAAPLLLTLPGPLMLRTQRALPPIPRPSHAVVRPAPEWLAA